MNKNIQYFGENSLLRMNINKGNIISGKVLQNDQCKLCVESYTSPLLFLKLYQGGINVCGSARTNINGLPCLPDYQEFMCQTRDQRMLYHNVGRRLRYGVKDFSSIF